MHGVVPHTNKWYLPTCQTRKTKIECYKQRIELLVKRWTIAFWEFLKASQRDSFFQPQLGKFSKSKFRVSVFATEVNKVHVKNKYRLTIEHGVKSRHFIDSNRCISDNFCNLLKKEARSAETRSATQDCFQIGKISANGPKLNRNSQLNSRYQTCPKPFTDSIAQTHHPKH